jgi:ParB family chromosome partitioning protein
MMPGRPFYIPMKLLDLEDETFRSSLQRQLEPLRGSIRLVGLLCPVRVQPQRGRFRVVSGFLRAEIVRSEGKEDLLVVKCDGEKSDEVLILETLHENRFTRGFSWAERAWVLGRIVQGWGKPRRWVIERVMPALDLHPAPRVLEEHLKVDVIAGAVKKAAIRSGCSMANALRIAQWSIPDQEALIPLFERLHLGENLLRECLERVVEIALREGVTPASFLSGEECRGVLENPKRDRPERTGDFRDYLRKKRYPTLFCMENAFRKAKARLAIPPKLSVEASSFFEETGIHVSFRARTTEEFQLFSEKLWEISRARKDLAALLQATEKPPSYQ